MIAWAWLAACDPAPTYGDDIAPIVDRSCVPCHAAGGASGRPLDTWADARTLGHVALAELASGDMPAGNLDRSGACGEFTGPEPVSDDDVATWSAWVDGGMQEGPTPQIHPVETAFSADAAFALGPFAASADNRCFLVDEGVEPGFLTGFRVTASRADAVHHAMLFTLPTGSDLARAQALDAEDPAVGWDCYADPGIPGAALAAVWTPGDPVVELPNGTGVALPGGPMVVQVHFGAAGDGATARLELALTGHVDRELAFVPIAATGFALAPGDAAVTWTETIALATPDLDVFGVFPHMHARGRALTLRAPDDCLADAPRWDFGWQEVAFYRDPVPLASGTRLELSCTFDTSDAAGVTVWGETSDDEMCMAFLLAARR
jgi:hypothetical protein